MSETHTPGTDPHAPLKIHWQYYPKGGYGPPYPWFSIDGQTDEQAKDRDLQDRYVELLRNCTGSYRKHCGDKAVELAEQDYLGELIYELQNMTVLARNLAGDVEFDSIKAADELLAKLPEPKDTP